MAVAAEERTLDFGRLYVVFNVMPGNITGFDRKGNPLGKRDKTLPVRESERYILQDGMIFDEAGKPVKAPPPEVTKRVQEMRDQHPSAGVTHAGVVRPCPVPGCGFRTTREEYYREHKRLHRDITAEQWMQLEAGWGARPVTLNLSDFANPSEVMDLMTGQGQAMSHRESGQGEG